MKQKMFRITHDLNNHNNFHRIYDRLANSIYVRRLTKHLKIYIEHCSKCQLNQIKRHSLYDSFQSIVTSIISFHILTINFILTLLIIDELNCVLTIVYKFIKKTMTFVNKNIYNVEN